MNLSLLIRAIEAFVNVDYKSKIYVRDGISGVLTPMQSIKYSFKHKAIIIAYDDYATKDEDILHE